MGFKNVFVGNDLKTTRSPGDDLVHCQPVSTV